MNSLCKIEEFSLISKEIHEILYDKSLKENTAILDIEQFFIGSLFNWITIEKYLTENHIDTKTDNFSYSYCLQCCKLLHPIWKHCQNFEGNSIIHNVSECLIWKFHICDILDIFTIESETSIIEGILLLTSIFENAIGNIYFTLTQQTPPHLLKDLLKTSEIREYFGSFPVYFLQLILGTPNSINLRNIVWHGFPSPKEIPEYFFGTILVTMMSLSEIYKNKPFKINYREKIKHIDAYFDFITDFQILELELDIKNEKLIKKNIEESRYCPKPHEIYWKTLYKYYLENNYKKFIILILPQIELAFRLIYSELNIFDVSGKINEYYITMDSIFEDKLPNTSMENQLYTEQFSEKILKLSYDLFISPNGPRIRDKISHGEVDFQYIDKKTCIIILTLGLLLLGNRNTNIGNFIDNYETRFHINAIFRNNVKQSLEFFKKLKGLQSHHYFVEPISSNIENFEHTNILIEIFNLYIFKRHSNEKIIIGFLNRIIININNICKNLLEFYEIKFKLLSERQLRSRERKTVHNMIKIYPNMLKTLSLMIESLALIFLRIHNDAQFIWIDKYYDVIVRFLKFFLKAVENFMQTSNILKNKIDKSDSICKSFVENLIKFKKETDL